MKADLSLWQAFLIVIFTLCVNSFGQPRQQWDTRHRLFSRLRFKRFTLIENPMTVNVVQTIKDLLI